MRLIYGTLLVVCAIFAYSLGFPAEPDQINQDEDLLLLDESDFLKEGGEY